MRKTTTNNSSCQLHINPFRRQQQQRSTRKKISTPYVPDSQSTQAPRKASLSLKTWTPSLQHTAHPIAHQPTTLPPSHTTNQHTHLEHDGHVKVFEVEAHTLQVYNLNV